MSGVHWASIEVVSVMHAKHLFGMSKSISDKKESSFYSYCCCNGRILQKRQFWPDKNPLQSGYGELTVVGTELEPFNCNGCCLTPRLFIERGSQ